MCLLTPHMQVSSTLSIPMSLYSDSGRYQCSVDNSILGPVLSDFAEIIVRRKLIHCMYNTYHVIFVPKEYSYRQNDLYLLPTATLSLSASENGQPLVFSDVISQPDGSAFNVICHGSGDLVWLSSNSILVSSNSTEELFQTFDSIGERVILTFTSFSSSQVGLYTCQSHLTDDNNILITETILVTNCKLII